jgi:hypothetical protein
MYVSEKDMQCAYNVTVRHFCVNIVIMGNQ